MVSERIRAQTATEASLFQVALSSIPNMNVELSFTKRAAKQFEKLIRLMTGESNGG